MGTSVISRYKNYLITRSRLTQFALVMAFCCLTGCISYGPALVGSEAPFVPVPVLDTVATTATGVYGMVGWPLVYNVNDRNQLVGAGVYQTCSLPAPSTSNLRGWSFVYGGAVYQSLFLERTDRLVYSGRVGIPTL